ncbi:MULTISPECIES: NAD(P)/FAD-dependent oxidoreductase [unclassified Mesorhizobium]|uniref:NAD(P)/FAD-dependent oxidoreductase n=1 Tax=unclassified Mesorhizobium TaxID=325217 RepID=UPI00112AB33C|nr:MULTISPECIES: NAD(P)/FAD-dependent oxidoreductase [unclassified Mesorhizobium]TPI53030.1 NAD(P)/FAD-dependent oxidoreductase [Mesorhizobium sp. B3-1-1]TPJ71056.1 NAD(P)/FAD-dependent oxidoreductase [Mesorhizobium sp. B2-6-7]TPJ85759.1 NAD(P)/FAD-dependent oxidoreductase [Mesorhizobium sp. B2-6-3]TPJ99627.1 NAD(P)/FAD-dependent oxidoreductase [Mesorhizobium sp. B2-5-10]TPK07796.1 NAD(P)/FAD-dependent oxidoreductase [Mesorhizobium sp. B2-5-11]
MQYDLAVVGGSFAGLSAAIQAARARRNVLVIDAGQPRNRFAAHSHGFLGQDGRTPGAILEEARRQLLAYPTARLVKGRADKAVANSSSDFEISTEGGETFGAARLVLATGVRDILPEVPGLAEQWGKTVLHCPYCHGYEVSSGPLGVLATGPMSLHQAQLIADWGDVTLFGNRLIEPDAEQMSVLEGKNVRFEPAAVAELREDGAGGLTVILDGGRKAGVRAIFTAPRNTMASPVAEQLGCGFTDGPLGPVISIDDRQQTTVPGVYAAGDASRAMHNIAFAVSGGAFAGICAHQSLVFG